ncbi:hypothetical protein I4U23_021910 [Adineta vaga]|nr:hypothetical protein I4U23_021910 [Adineta vaga]
MTLTIFTSLDYISEVKCRQALLCLLGINQMENILSIINKDPCESFSDPGESLSDHCMSKWIIFPEYPILFRFFQFIYFTNRSIEEFKINILPDLICFNKSICPGLLYCSIDIQIHNGLNCCQITFEIDKWGDVPEMFEDLIFRCALIGKDKNCSDSSLFHCRNSSKCISKRKLLDNYADCYFYEDEDVSGCELNDTKRFTSIVNPNKCYSIVGIEPREKVGFNSRYENPIYKISAWKRPFLFQRICDGSDDLSQVDDSDETDETNCQWWPCNNPYVRCNTYWNCLNGLDELNCSHNSCSANEHVCIREESLENFCFPITHLMEDYTKFEIEEGIREIYLTNKTISNIRNYLFWNQTKCITPEHLLRGHSVLSLTDGDVCLMTNDTADSRLMKYRMEIDQLLCSFTFRVGLINKRPFFLTSRLSYFPPVLSTEVSIRRTSPLSQSKNFDLPIDMEKYWYCNRGIPILFKTSNSSKCLCPPSYFGNRCQWQNQRISLTIQLIYRNFNLTYIMPIFELILILIDEQGQIGPYHERLTYVPKRDCGIKFNIYLLYPDKPKNLSANYSIHIHLFDKMTLTYWGTWHLSIPFQFLPVNRISTKLFIPNIKEFGFLCPLSCGNYGKCVPYINKNDSCFCKCDKGYSGLKCNVKENCSCSLDSYCLTSSICICPMNKFGRKCYLNNSICQLENNSCQNNGQCIPIDDRIGMKKFTCLCPENFNGEKCENKIQNIIDIEFDENIIKSDSAVFVHLMRSFGGENLQHTILLKKIRYGQNRIRIYVTISFHIVFIESINGNYYLIVVREQFIESEYIETKLLSNQQQCVFIDQLLNITIKSYSYLDRIKYYPFFCRQNKELMCFYDENYMCLCDLDRFSNCFMFDHNAAYDCQGENDCENGGKCFQDNTTCPVVSLCICPDLARSRSIVRPSLSFIEHLKLQFKEHKHHFIASCALVLLSIPRLIISFISGCMKSPSNSWLFLFAYFISFLPSMMIFFIYVLSSTTYKEECNIIVQKIIRRFRNRT